ncbi:MAG: ZIP family metal transporter [Chloroflexi bacterium]|nr:ZIP family metal transporter [Chloroflexota bacterium]
MENLLPIMGLSFLGSIAGLIGGLFLLWKGSVEKETSLHLIAFAAGVILGVVFLDLLPEAQEFGGQGTFFLALIGLVAFFLIEDFLLHFHHHEEHAHRVNPVAPLIILGDTVHNFIDGAVIAASFLADARLGVLVAVATFFHEVPQEIGDFAVLLSAGLSKTEVLLSNLLTAMATFMGAIGVLLFVEQASNFLGPLLGLAAGMFLYISSADILPEIARTPMRDPRWHTAGFFLGGIGLMFLLTEFLPG